MLHLIRGRERGGGGGGGGVEGAGEEGDLLSPLMAFSNIHVIDIFTIY